MADDKAIGTSLNINNENAIFAINEALRAGELTVEELEAMFANADVAMPDVNFHTVTNAQTTK
jgi:hypothetical protein